MEYLAPISLLVLIAISGLLLLKKSNRKKPVVSEHTKVEDTRTHEEPLPEPIEPDSSKHIIPAGKYPANVDPMDPRGDGTIRPGDEMWEIFQMTLKGNSVIGNRRENGDVEVEVLPMKDSHSENEVSESSKKF